MKDTITVRVRSVAWESGRIKSYELRSPAGDPLPPFTAGAHIDLHLPNGLTRSYSLLNDPADRDRYRVGIALDENSRGGSRCVHERLAAGDLMRIGTPSNNFPLDEGAAHSLLIAGGIGITPFLSMVARLERLGRSWELHYGVRQRDDAAFLTELEPFTGRVHLHCQDEAGFVDIGALIARAPAGTHFYCCGPQGMLEAYRNAAAGIAPEQVHFEYFSAAEAPATDGGFTVELARSKREIRVPPGRSLLDALSEAGIAVAYSCQEGVCGTCETRVLAGTPDHRDSVLTAAERAAGTTMMVCCSGSKSDRLVLDL